MIPAFTKLTRCLTRMAQSGQDRDGGIAGGCASPEGASALGLCWARLGTQRQLRGSQFLHPSPRSQLFTCLGVVFPPGRSDNTSIHGGGCCCPHPQGGDTTMQSWGLGPWGETGPSPSPSSIPQPVRFRANHLVSLRALPSLEPGSLRASSSYLHFAHEA